MAARTSAVSLLLLVSGMCALVIQMAWLRELKLIFGGSTPAAAAVIAIFMGGLGLGNAVLGPRADASRSPLQLYARLEMGISLTTMLSPLLLLLARSIYIALGGQETFGLALATALRLLLAALVVGPPTFLMGGTLPAAARAITSSDDISRGAVGRLYGLNTLGAVLGAVLSTFVVLEWLGTRTTLWTFSVVNLLNALVAWKLSSPRVEGPGFAIQKTIGDTERRGSAQSPTVVYLVAAVVGFAFFLMEMIWYRMLGPILGGTTFTLGLILAVALAGIGVGGAIYPLAFRSRKPDASALALTLGYEALALAIPFALGDRLAILTSALRPLGTIGFGGQLFGWLLVSLIVVFPAALVSGIQFPLLVALLGRGSNDLGKQLGRALGWNTVGAIVGALAGGFGLIPLLSATGAWKLVVVLLAVGAMVVLIDELRSRRQLSRLLHPLLACAAAGICLTATGPTAVWRHSGIGAGRANLPMTTRNDLQAWMNTTRRNILWEADGRESSVAISTDRGINFVVNGKADGHAVNDAGTQVMLGVLGVLLHAPSQDGLVIGLGTGESAGWLAHQPATERVDVVEIEPAIRHVADVCAALNHDVLRHPKVRVVVNDARETLLTTRQQYDLVASEPSNPYRSGVSSLYTREFYQAVRSRLKPGGLFLQWLQGYEIDVPTFRTVLCTLAEVFGHVEIWETTPADLVLVCSPESLTYTAAELSARMQEPAMRDALRVAWRTVTLEGVVAHLIATADCVQAIVSQGLGVVNTDDRNVLEYRFARTIGLSGGFTVGGLRAEVAAAGMQRLARLEKDVDWEAVEDARIAYHAAAGDAPLSATLYSGDRARRAEALLAFQSQEGLAAIARLWESQPKPPRDLIETIAVACGAAAQGDERALKIIEPIRSLCPIEAGFVASMLAARQRRPAASASALADVFRALQRDPTPLPAIAEHAVRLALEVASQDSRQIPLLFSAMREPFALRMAEDARTTVLCLLGNAIGPRKMVEALAQAEPYPRWNARMLELRVQAYEAARHPLLNRARNELSNFQAHAGGQAVLAPQMK